jgi:ADP-L-glycero-D-manno-heptose 6-epimerase
MIVITGAAGFIGSVIVQKFNENGIDDLVLVDDFSKSDKIPNFSDKKYREKIDRNFFENWALQNSSKIEFIIHIGARTDTSEFDVEVFNKLNLNYSKMMWNFAVDHSIPFIYASSAATYGMGEFGFEDAHDIIPQLKPLNPYGESKNDFDKWVINQTIAPPFWAGFKFFNVYGPNEYHKKRMASVIYHAEKQIFENGYLKLFKSHRPDFEDGKQLRDFVYVMDVADVILWFVNHQKNYGIYNLGTGIARSFLDLGLSTFKALGLQPKIEFVDTPIDIRDKYQYFTEANMSKLRNAGYQNDFFPLEDGIEHYVKNFLVSKKTY